MLPLVSCLSGRLRWVLTVVAVHRTWFSAVIESFDDMGLKEDLLRGIYSYGFEKPSAIQQRAIKPLLMMRDTIAQAQSGTGKTATFTIGEHTAPHPAPTGTAAEAEAVAMRRRRGGGSAGVMTDRAVGGDKRNAPPPVSGRAHRFKSRWSGHEGHRSGHAGEVTWLVDPRHEARSRCGPVLAVSHW